MSQSAPHKIVVLGTMCHQPLAGMVLLFLQYLLGFERLGFETYYVEWHGRWVPHPDDPRQDSEFNRVHIGKELRRHGFGDRWICQADHLSQGQTLGPLQRSELPRLYSEAAAIVNVTGAHVLNDEQMGCSCRIYLETDPGIPQAKIEQADAGMLQIVDAHTHHFTWAQNLHNTDCLLPHTHLHYNLTRQPIVLDLWDTSDRFPGSHFTTVSKWEKRGKDILVGDEKYLWSKHHQFMRFVDLPRQTKQPLELALSGVRSEDRDMLVHHGWSIRDAWPISITLDGYQKYIAGSRGEFTIAKDQYTRLRTGWFSDRSACYLAAGKPVVTQDSRFDITLPVGEGLFSFNTSEDAAAAFETINSDPIRHGLAAAEIAREYFDAEKVLSKLLQDVGIELPRKISRMTPTLAVPGNAADESIRAS